MTKIGDQQQNHRPDVITDCRSENQVLTLGCGIPLKVDKENQRKTITTLYSDIKDLKSKHSTKEQQLLSELNKVCLNFLWYNMLKILFKLKSKNENQSQNCKNHEEALMKSKEQNRRLEDRIKQLESQMKENDEEKTSCPICFHKINQERKWIVFCCGHRTCAECYKKLKHEKAWGNKTCPICRSVITNYLTLNVMY